MRADIIDGDFEFHRDDQGNVTIIEHVHGEPPQIVVISARVWGQAWPKLISLREFRKLAELADLL